MALPVIPVVVGQAIKARIFCACGPQLAVNVLYWKIGSMANPGAGDLKLLGEALSAVVAPAYKVMMSNEARYRGLGIQGMEPLPVPTVEILTNVGNGTGGSIDAVLPKQVCGLITKRTAFATPNFRGRVYIPFPSEEFSTELGTPLPGYVNHLNFLGETIFKPLTVNPVGMGATVLNPQLRRDTTPHDPNDSFFGYEPIVDFTSQPKWATQRRRGDYGSPNEFPI